VRAAVLEATVEAVLEAGFGGVSVADVARRAGVHETSIYRRWGTRENLIADALLSRVGEEAPIPDTGSLEDDLLTFVREGAAFLESPLGGALARMAAATVDSAEMAAARRELWSKALANASRMFERAVEKGELAPGVDPELAVEALIGPLYLRLLVTGEPLEVEFLDGVVRIVLRGVGR
jgi:AcrR family transcriptional regulator